MQSSAIAAANRPSEHTLEGRHNGGELHFVHTHTDSESGETSYLVLGVFVNGDGENESSNVDCGYFCDFHDAFVELKGLQKSQKVTVSGKFDMNDMFQDGDTFIHYTGSLTTHPCTNGVLWFVLDRVVTVPDAQLQAVTDFFLARYQYPSKGNYRGVQAINSPDDFRAYKVEAQVI
eukprot:GHVU01040518.1.p1 GENE.GHVU01040518.1~~GHVU01040518.1.p1  ORF type:complete len:176 (-),score=25.29 GHVU01040518.1:419-946(-)